MPRRWVRHPLVYIFSLGVYASAWAFYGSVGMASQYGYGFLAYYLGIAGAFVLSPVLLRPILHITRIYQLSSLADLLAFRYRSRLAGMLVSLFMLAVVVPMLTLQISAVADTLYLLNNELSLTTLAFGFCVVMVLFAVLFGARHVSPREKHEGLVFALAFESLVKLLAILVLGGVVLLSVFAGRRAGAVAGGSSGVADQPAADAAGRSVAHVAAGVFCRGGGDAAHVSRHFHRKT